MANYSSKFIKDYATITEPLRELTRKNTRFTWTRKHQAAYDKLKHALPNSPVMIHFDASKETFILVDASPVGLISAILAQKDPQQNAHNIIAYASRALSPVEKRYSHTEKEALEIVWGSEQFHLYVFGAPFTLITDHKPSQLIYNNPQSRPPARIERWFLRLQQYDFQVIYKKGSDNPADFLSRHPQLKVPKRSVAEEYMNFVTVHTAEAAIPLTVIREHTSKDSNLVAVRKAVESGDWTDELVKPFFNIKEEIAVDNKNGVVLRGTRINTKNFANTHCKTCPYRSPRSRKDQSSATPTRLVSQYGQGSKPGNRDMFTVPSQWTPELSRTVAITRKARWTVANLPR